MSLKNLSLLKIEEALDSGLIEVEVRVHPSRWWTAKRNGQTKTWVTRPADFRIPIKAGLKAYGYITPVTLDSFRVKGADQ